MGIRMVALALVLVLAAGCDGKTVVEECREDGGGGGADASIDTPAPDGAADGAADAPSFDTDAGAGDAGTDAAGCAALCAERECGLTGPGDKCDCGSCEAGYTCSPEGACTADCQVLCAGRECGPAGAEAECDCGLCGEGLACSAEGLCTADCGAACAGRECGPAGPDGACDCGVCDDGNACTLDGCTADGQCDSLPLEDGEPCDDGEPCTGDDLCVAGECGGAIIGCDDQNPCTDDACEEDTGDCGHTPNGLLCDDGDPCTTGDVCADATCAGEPIDCTCTTDADCTALEDGDLCNGTLVCNIAFLPSICAVDLDTILECPGAPPGPDAPCLAPSCDPGTGACDLVPAAEGQACGGADACSIGSTCQAGVCAGGATVNCNDGNPCTDDLCNPEAGCHNPPNSLPCNDGNACTTGDVCTDGVCGGTPAAGCDDGNVCTADSCEPLSGCLHEPVAGACDDLNLCTGEGTCSGGACLPGPAVPCNDGNPCTDDACDPATGCTTAFNTGACDDGDPCTAGDACADGACAGTAVTCDDKNPCTDDTCDPVAGCQYTPDDTNPCVDQNPCTLGDRCEDGACVPEAMDSCDDDNPCTTDSCDPVDGCLGTPNAVPCDDGDPCTSGDLCGGGVCAGTGISCDDGNPCTDDACDETLGCQHTDNTDPCDDLNTCTTSDQCSDGICRGTGALDCDDGKPCTKDVCLPDGGCAHENVSGACSDGNPCTLNDACVDGACVPGATAACDDQNPCTDDACVDGQCVFTDNDAVCDDGNACTTGDHCTDGVCAVTGALPCDDGNVCTTDSCNPLTGCVTTPNTLACSDGNACTAGDVCASGTCKAGSGLTCSDGNGCTDDACNPATGCVFTPNTATCNDGNACTTGDACSGGTCKASGALACDDGKVCTTDSCVPATGCSYANNTLACNDGNACTTGDVCAGGTCAGPTTVTCTDGNVCTTDSCNTATGCVFTPNTAACNDGNACTTGDVCAGSVCTGPTPVTCSDGNDCTDDSCVPATGCKYVARTGTCNDGNACTTGDTCTAGFCKPTGVVACDDGKVCTTDTCVPATGCSYANNTLACTDGNACTLGDICGGGLCLAGTTALACDDGNDCTDDSCASATGCSYDPNTDPCDDGNPCTVTDTCAAGMCTGAGALDCADGNTCTDDSCDPDSGCVYDPVPACCGNGTVEGPEECDDGNQVNGDLCDEGCNIEDGQCDPFSGANGTTVSGWTEQVGDWSIASQQLKAAATSSWQWITRNGSTAADGCATVRAIYGSGISVRAVGLTGRWSSATVNVMAKIQDNANSGYFDSYFIYQNNSILVYQSGLNFGTDAWIGLQLQGTAVTFRVDTNRDGTWDYTYNATVTNSTGLWGLAGYNGELMDDFCALSSCASAPACQEFTAPNGPTVPGWTKQGGNWTISGQQLKAAVTSTWQWITLDGSSKADGCMTARALYGTGTGVKGAGLTGRWSSSAVNVMVKIQDNNATGYFDSYYIYSNNGIVAYVGSGLNFGTDAIIGLQLAGAIAVLRVDTNRDGTWDFTYSASVANTSSGLWGIYGYNGELFDHVCSPSCPEVTGCDGFPGANGSSIPGWTEQVGDWSLLSQQLRSQALDSWQWLTLNASARSNGCSRVRAIYGSGSSVRASGLTARWASTNSNIMAKIQDNAVSGYYDSYYIYDGTSLLKYQSGLNFGKDAIIGLQLNGTAVTFRVDTNRDGTWDFTYATTATTTASGLWGLNAYSGMTFDDFCLPATCP